MLRRALLLSFAALAATVAVDATAGKRTVCTITVNSTDEREAFRRHLPVRDYEFVELVERGRRDWLASACNQQVKCDMLVISGHFNGEHFFSDQLQNDEHLPVAEMERASCSESCPGLFSQLKEVYMFGCNSLNSDRLQSVSSEIVRTLVNGGQSRGEAERVAQMLVERHTESNRDVMRRVFVGAPAIYGFSSVAPVGATAGPILNRYLQGASLSEVGSGRPNRKLLGHFASHSMTVASGMERDDPRAAHRAEVCHFVDDRLAPAEKLGFIHRILERDPAQARMFLERIERFLATLTESDRRSSPVVEVFAKIERDEVARNRYVEFMRNNETTSARVRLTNVAHAIGWLSGPAHEDETARVILDVMASQRTIGPADVDEVCKLNAKGRYDHALAQLPASGATTTAQAAVLACLGSDDHRDRMLQALSSTNERDIEMAEVYFHHRPIADAEELRIVTSGIASLPRPDAQVRALNALSRQSVADADGLDALARLYPVAETPTVQRAIAGVYLRTDHRAIATPELVRMFREHRKATTPGDIIDALIRRLERVVTRDNAQALR